MSLLLLLLHNANAQHSFPPPPKKEKLARNCCFFNNCFTTKFVPNFPAKFPQNRLFFPQICPLKSHEFVFFCDLS